MRKSVIRWLYQELPSLVEKGILSAESAQKLQDYYGPVPPQRGSNPFLMVFGLLGALLIGLGIILLVAHNWAELSRAVRLIVSLSLLLGAQALSAFVIWKKGESRIWREGTAALHVLTIGATMALVGQTYHLTEDTDRFLLTWLLLSLPLVYLLDAGIAAVLYVLGTVLWTINMHFQPAQLWAWALLLLALPFFWQRHQFTPNENSTILLFWVLNICFYILFIASLAGYLDTFMFLIFSLLFSTNYLASFLWCPAGQTVWRIPSRAIGIAGSIGVLFLLTFRSVWSHLRFAADSAHYTEYVLTALLAFFVAWGCLSVRRRMSHPAWPIALSPLAVGAAYGLEVLDSSGTAATLLMNACQLLFSFYCIAQGTKYKSLSQANGGLFLLAILVVSRFFDMNFSFAARGLVFVLLGLAFLLTNWVMLRQKAGGRHE